MWTPNQITAYMAILAFILCAWALRGSFRRPDGSAVSWMRLAMLSLSLFVLGRMIQWDIVLMTIRSAAPHLSAELRYYGNWGNGIWNLGFVWSVFCVGKALLEYLPDEDRDHYSMWNIWFYPQARGGLFKLFLQSLGVKS